MNKANDLALLDEFLNSEPFMYEMDKMAAAYPLCQEARADFDRALEAVKPRLDNFREWDALDCANTICAVAYAKLGVLYGMRILSIFQSGLANSQALGDLIVARMRGTEAACKDEGGRGSAGE